MRKHKNKITAGVCAVILLAFAFWYGGDAPGLRGWIPEQKPSVNITEEVKQETKETEIEKPDETSPEQAEDIAADENKPQNTASTPVAKDSDVFVVQKESEADSTAGEMVIDETTGKDKYLTDPVPEGKPLPIEPENSVISDKELTCTLSVRCDTILNNIGWLCEDKIGIVPKDGVIFAEKTVTFYDGESVFNLLVREMKKNKIHLEFENVPIYNSAYIEGIANLYEFDCGELSGWMYKVNEWFPNYGCSRYLLKAGDRVEWVYTCDLGVDVDGYYAAKGEQK